MGIVCAPLSCIQEQTVTLRIHNMVTGISEEARLISFHTS